MKFWRLVYRALVDLRNTLNVAIAFARARAYPKLARHVADPAVQP